MLAWVTSNQRLQPIGSYVNTSLALDHVAMLASAGVAMFPRGTREHLFVQLWDDLRILRVHGSVSGILRDDGLGGCSVLLGRLTTQVKDNVQLREALDGVRVIGCKNRFGRNGISK